MISELYLNENEVTWQTNDGFSGVFGDMATLICLLLVFKDLLTAIIDLLADLFTPLMHVLTPVVHVMTEAFHVFAKFIGIEKGVLFEPLRNLHLMDLLPDLVDKRLRIQFLISVRRFRLRILHFLVGDLIRLILNQ